MVRILVLLGAINAVFIEFFHLHPSGAVNHAFGVNRDAYVAYLAVMMVKEQQVSGFDFGGVGYRPSLGDLLARVALMMTWVKPEQSMPNAFFPPHRYGTFRKKRTVCSRFSWVSVLGSVMTIDGSIRKPTPNTSKWPEEYRVSRVPAVKGMV